MSRVEQLEDRIAELEHALGVTAECPKSIWPSGTFRLKNCEQLLGMLLARQIVTRDAIFIGLYGNLPECDQPKYHKMADVILHYVRKALKPHGVTVRNRYGTGSWYLTEYDKEKVRALIERLKAEAA